MPNLSQQPDRPLGPLFGERSPDGQRALGASDPYMEPRPGAGSSGATNSPADRVYDFPGSGYTSTVRPPFVI